MLYRTSTDKGTSNLRFKGASPEWLSRVGRWGRNPVIAPLVSSAGILAIRPAITMMDKETPKEDRIYSASWQAGVALGGLGVIAAYSKKIENLSGFIAEKILGIKLGAQEKRIAEKTPYLAEAVHHNAKTPSPYSISQILNYTDQQADDLVSNLEKKLAAREKFSLRGTLNSLNPANLFKKAKEIINPFEAKPDLVREVIQNKDDVRHLMSNNAAAAKRILAKTGASKVVNFVLMMSALTGATFLITRYLDPLMKFVGKTFDIKALKNGVESSDSDDSKKEEKETDKKKWGLLDKTILAGLGSLALIEGINLLGGKRNIAYEGIARAFLAMDEKLKIKDILGKPFEWIKKSPRLNRFTDAMVKQANVNDEWIERSVIFNLAARLAINLPTGQYYNATRDVVDQTMNLGLMGIADKTVISPARKALAKLLKVSEYNEGVKVITDQVVKNLIIICTIMGFLNNAISSRFIKVLKQLGIGKADEKENNYIDFRKRFLATQNLQEFDLNAVKLGTVSPVNNIISPSALALSPSDKKEVVFASFMSKIKEYKKEA